ncbi:hypothetical protein DFQ04_3471 [Algoriphagus boseongensis]|uniref:Uncharacterized protein n=1 Tax=Algoriphagus boseongensis TaxID=1442587 RepID=A0A4R6T4W6_9BACT|nr:hypothetical protein DFQ04_3471 [Algoriphagus boseongensis]
MRLFLFLIFLISPVLVSAQEEEILAVSRTVNLYFEGMMERDKGNWKKPFSQMPNLSATEVRICLLLLLRNGLRILLKEVHEILASFKMKLNPSR